MASDSKLLTVETGHGLASPASYCCQSKKKLSSYSQITMQPGGQAYIVLGVWRSTSMAQQGHLMAAACARALNHYPPRANAWASPMSKPSAPPKAISIHSSSSKHLLEGGQWAIR